MSDMLLLCCMRNTRIHNDSNPEDLKTLFSSFAFTDELF